MRNSPNQGLAGKARRQRVRSRTTRLYQQQLIEDYLQNKKEAEEAIHDRSIPIGHRREFVPTADAGPDDSAAGQLGMTITPVDNDSREAYIAVPKAQHRNVSTNRSSIPVTGSRATEKPKPASRSVAMPAPFAASESKSNSAAEFTWRGFGIGCAVGGAAAAVLLVFVRIAFA